jgi:acetyl/propionyl-CoA carboxylase alpha subunit
VRVCAEDPRQGFLPQAGVLALYREPAMPGVRVDSGVTEGGEVSVHYDSLLAKLVAWRRNARGGTAARPVKRSHHFPILGIRTNVPC